MEPETTRRLVAGYAVVLGVLALILVPGSSSRLGADDTAEATEDATRTATPTPAAVTPRPAPEIEVGRRGGQQAVEVRPTPSHRPPPVPSGSIPQGVELTVPDLNRVCNTDAKTFTVSWTEAKNATAYRVTAFGAGLSGSFDGPALSHEFSCPHLAGSVTVQAYAYNDRNEQSDVAWATRDYLGPMDIVSYPGEPGSDTP